MRCEELADLLDAYADGELPAPIAAPVASHLQDCPDCRAALASIEGVRQAVASLGRPEVPARLEARVRERLAAAGATSGRPVPVPAIGRLRSWLLFPIGVAVGAAAMLLAVSIQPSGPPGEGLAGDRLASDLVAAHVRASLAPSPVQIASADPHTVRPWFTGRTTFAPRIADPTAAGFPIVGGRLDYVADGPAAAIALARRAHRIDLFVWRPPAEATSAWQHMSRSGYNIVRWSDGDLAYALVSDLNEPELTLLSRILRGHGPT